MPKLRDNHLIPQLERVDLLEIEEIISQTVGCAISKLIMSGLMTNNNLTAVQRTETILKNYTLLKESVRKNESSEKFMAMVNDAINNIKLDDYFEIIPMTYFEDRSREQIAEFFDTSVRTVNRRKKRLLEKLSIYIFPDSAINEIL